MNLLRTLTIITIITLLLLGGSLGSYQYIKTSTHALGIPLETVERSITDQKWKMAGDELNNAQLRWGKDKNLWTILLNHQDIDNINISIKRLDSYIQAQDYSQSLGELAALKHQVNQILESSKLNWKNIF